MTTSHAVLASDRDKTACGVRISDKPERSVADTPMDITCDICALRVLRSLQQENPGVPAAELTGFPMPSLVWRPS